ncbi:hypothetical protein Q9X96_004365 [Vibrio vulnificus]|nr:hypothetical protein [Vibrio vulnificus]MCU8356824.1 hypothetical protein [Vibrio vulnificus]
MNHSFDNQTLDFGKSGLKFENLEMDFLLSQRPNLALTQKLIEAIL